MRPYMHTAWLAIRQPPEVIHLHAPRVTGAAFAAAGAVHPRGASRLHARWILFLIADLEYTCAAVRAWTGVWVNNVPTC